MFGSVPSARRRSALSGLVLLVGSCASPPRDAPVSRAVADAAIEPVYHADPIDGDVVDVVMKDLSTGRDRIRTYFGRDFALPFDVHVLPTRAAFDAFFRERWGIDETECWWVAAGLASDLVLLSPRVWATDACDHDPGDASHVREIVMHELVHVYHGQKNPGFEELEEIGWFIEGLATLVSGQLDDGRRERLRDALAAGEVELARLEDAWSGPHRYAIAGSLVELIEATRGRDAVIDLLPARTESEILAAVGWTEEEMIAGWRRFVLDRTAVAPDARERSSSRGDSR